MSGARAESDPSFELRAEELSFAVDMSAAEEASRSAEWGDAVIGQGRALEALRMGVSVRAKGYNVYVSGAPGTGRRTAVLRALSEAPAAGERLRDLVYVYNFSSPLEPTCLVLPPGGGKAFKRDLHRMVEALKRIVGLQEIGRAHV